MSGINDNVKLLYDALKKEGYGNLGSVEQFDGLLKDSGNREYLYKSMKDEGFSDLGEYSEFESMLGYDMPNDLKQSKGVLRSDINPEPYNLRPEYTGPTQEQPDYVNPLTNSPEYNFESIRQKGKIETVSPQPQTPKEQGFWGTFAGDVIQRMYAGAQDFASGAAGAIDKGARVLENVSGGVIERGGIFGDLSKSLKESAQETRAKSDRYNGKGFKELWKEGDYLGAGGDVLLGGAESIAMSIAAAASSIINPAAGLVGIGAISASQKYDQLDESNPDLDELTKSINAILSGTFEAGSELLGAGVSNAWIKGLYKTMGKEKAEQAIQQGLLGKLREHFKRFGIFYEPVEEGLEEVSSQFAQNVTDKITGVSPDMDVTEGLADSFVYGMGGGAYFSAANLLDIMTRHGRALTPLTITPKARRLTLTL